MNIYPQPAHGAPTLQTLALRSVMNSTSDASVTLDWLTDSPMIPHLRIDAGAMAAMAPVHQAQLAMFHSEARQALSGEAPPPIDAATSMEYGLLKRTATLARPRIEHLDRMQDILRCLRRETKASSDDQISALFDTLGADLDARKATWQAWKDAKHLPSAALLKILSNHGELLCSLLGMRHPRLHDSESYAREHGQASANSHTLEWTITPLLEPILRDLDANRGLNDEAQSTMASFLRLCHRDIDYACQVVRKINQSTCLGPEFHAYLAALREANVFESIVTEPGVLGKLNEFYRLCINLCRAAMLSPTEFAPEKINFLDAVARWVSSYLKALEKKVNDGRIANKIYLLIYVLVARLEATAPEGQVKEELATLVAKTKLQYAGLPANLNLDLNAFVRAATDTLAALHRPIFETVDTLQRVNEVARELWRSDVPAFAQTGHGYWTYPAPWLKEYPPTERLTFFGHHLPNPENELIE